LLVNDTSLAVRPASPYWLDVEVFEAAVASCQAASGYQLDAAQAALLAEAVELYTGDLLEGSYGEWCLYERERLSLLHLATLTKLATYYEQVGNWSRGLHSGNCILARDNTRERVHLQMMRLYWQAGDRDAALAQYKRCNQILRDELGVAPMRETTLVYQQMAHNQYSPPLAARSPSAMPPAVSPAMPMALPPALPQTRQHRNAAAEPADGGLQALAEKTLQRVQYLQSLLEETRAELRSIETLIHHELLNSDLAK
jgi:hypothetical protein